MSTPNNTAENTAVETLAEIKARSVVKPPESTLEKILATQKLCVFVKTNADNQNIGYIKLLNVENGRLSPSDAGKVDTALFGIAVSSGRANWLSKQGKNGYLEAYQKGAMARKCIRENESYTLDLPEVDENNKETGQIFTGIFSETGAHFVDGSSAVFELRRGCLPFQAVKTARKPVIYSDNVVNDARNIATSVVETAELPF